MSERKPDVIVIGAGVIGLTAALALQRRGLSVTLVERTGVAAQASAGNAGAFAFSDVLPLASPGIMRKAPKWLLDPNGPLAVPWRYAPQITPWLLRFWRASRPHRVAAGVVAQAALNNLARERLFPLLDDVGLRQALTRSGNLEVYESEAELDAVRRYWDARADHGIAFEHIHGAADIAAVQPGLHPRFKAATLTPEWYHIDDPADFCRRLGAIFQRRDGTLQIADAVALEGRGERATVRLADGATLSADHVVVCAGAWSHRLARTLGDRIPLETERGYNVTLPLDAFDLGPQITFGGHGFVVTRLATGIRIGGGVELGGLDLPPNHRRAAAMLAKARAFLPDLKVGEGRRWMGFRPSLPDSLPVIGPATRDPRVVYAFGHGHLGLTQSAATAELVADLVTGRGSAIDLTPFRPDRF